MRKARFTEDQIIAVIFTMIGKALFFWAGFPFYPLFP